MPHLSRAQLLTLIGLVSIVCALGFFAYLRLSPSGLLADLKNDLKTIAPEESASYTDLDGNAVDIRKFKGKPLIVNAWASWMPFSQTELPLLIKSQETYGDRITILAINRMEDRVKIRAFLSTFSIPESIVFLADPTDFFYRAVGGYAMPETVFYRSDGTIAEHKRGVLTEEELKEKIELLLAE